MCLLAFVLAALTGLGLPSPAQIYDMNQHGCQLLQSVHCLFVQQ